MLLRVSKFLPELNCPEDISVEKGIFRGVKPEIVALFKNDQKLEKKNVFFQLKVRSNIKT